MIRLEGLESAPGFDQTGNVLTELEPEQEFSFRARLRGAACGEQSAQLSVVSTDEIPPGGTDIVVSGIEKVAKPDPAIFNLAATRFGHLPADMLFIDDNRANIAAARALGWQVHHFAEAGALAADLRARGLLD